jgi:quercetin dioxygenase-like cupin family protein
MSLLTRSHAMSGESVLAAMTAAAMILALAQTPTARRIAQRCATALMFSTASVEAGAGRPATRIEPLSCEKLAHVPGKAVTTVLVHFPPLAYSAAHRHPGSVTAFVVKGTVRSQMAGSPAVDYPVGGTWFEAPGALHVFAENPSALEPAELLAVFVTDDDCGPLVIPELG